MFRSGATAWTRCRTEAQKELNECGINLNRISTVCKYSPCYRVITWLWPRCLTDRCMCVCVSPCIISWVGWHGSREPTQWASRQQPVGPKRHGITGCTHTYMPVANNVHNLSLHMQNTAGLVSGSQTSDMTWHRWHTADSSWGCCPAGPRPLYLQPLIQCSAHTHTHTQARTHTG